MGCFLVEQKPDSFSRPASVADDGDKPRFDVFGPSRTSWIAVGSATAAATTVIVGLILTSRLFPVVQP